MAWELRGNRTYYYRSVRSGTRVTKEYAGGGLMGALAEEFEEEQREQRAHERATCKKERAKWAALEESARELDDLAELLTAAMLTTTGYHRHDRGEWRRRRGQ
jgi:hypothetical protein